MKAFALFALTSFLGLLVTASVRADPPKRPVVQIENLRNILKGLDLSAEQTATITPILEEGEAKLREVQKSGGDERRAARQQFEAQLNVIVSKIQAQLTPE